MTYASTDGASTGDASSGDALTGDALTGDALTGDALTGGSLVPATRIILTPQPTVGLVIGTFGAVPYIHLGLESWRRSYPHIPVLVHDDGSAHTLRLRALCQEYGAAFSANEQRYGHNIGDLSTFVAGCDWARQSGLDVLVKFSRRFIPLTNWVPELQHLAWTTQYATYSNRADPNLGFRSECVGLHVASWLASGAVALLRAQFASRQTYLV